MPNRLSWLVFDANEYIESFDKDVLLLSEEIESEDLGYSAIQKILNKKDIEIIGDKENLQPQNAIRTINNFFNSYGKDLREFKNLTDEICHFEKISSDLDLIIIDEINKKIKEIVKNSNIKSEKELNNLRKSLNIPLIIKGRFAISFIIATSSIYVLHSLCVCVLCSVYSVLYYFF